MQAGFSVLSIDHESTNAKVPIIPLDLTSPSGVAILWDILESENLLGVHMGLPCGTASLARERPVSEKLQALGVPNPPPLRSALYPLGLPGLSSFHQAKVDSANSLYRLAVEILVYCHKRGLVVSIENPANSWLWAALVRITMERQDESAQVLNHMEKVEFHACCHGSTRRKNTGWLGTPGVYSKLAAVCTYDHPHEGWGVQLTTAGWVFDTSTEAAYPPLLAQRVVECLTLAAKSRNFCLEKQLRLHDHSTAAVGLQSKRHPPIIPEFHHFLKQPASTPIQPGTKLLSPHLGGEVREDPDFDDCDKAEQMCKVGVFHTSKQFLSLAQAALHPMDTVDHLEPVTKYALEFNLRYPAELIKLERKKNLLHARLLAKQSETQEAELHAGLPPCLQKVLQGKRLLVWKGLLEKYEYDDLQVFDFMVSGVKLTGKHDTPSCYPEKIKPATLSQQDLETSAVWRRRATLGKRRAAADDKHVAHLEETAAEELQMGFIEGPFFSESEVSAHFGHNHWSIVRRFILVQGAELKLRPIDDCLEAQLNKAYTSTSYLKLQDVDYITGLALRIAEAVSAGRQQHGSGEWLGKCLDLSKAYKQVGVHPEHRHLAVIFYHRMDGTPVFYVANSLMFGATAAVYSFNRISRSLWFLLNRCLVIPCGVFYDDFPLFSPKEVASDADSCASDLLDLLGWRHARTGPKGRPFDGRFQVLGCSLDLTGIAQGSVVAENRPGRIDRLLEHLQKIKTAGVISLHEAQVLHGLLRYSCGFFAGRHLHQVCAEVMSYGVAKSGSRGQSLADFCDYATQALKSSKPRTLRVGLERKPILIFTDGAWENGVAGIGAVVVDTSTNQRWVWSGSVPQCLVDNWLNLVGDQLICQIELYAMVALRWSLASLLCDRRSIWWVDNEAARFAAIKGVSPSLVMRNLVRLFYDFETTSPTFSWIERVPSWSNPADGPSRGSPQEVMQLLGISECGVFENPPDLVQQLLKLAGHKRGMEKPTR